MESLALEHGPDGIPTNFFVCAAWDEARAPAACDAAAGATLPADTVLRLEQRPVGAAAASPDSPGWATVGTSDVAELEVPLSDFVSGLDVDKATYRVTLRPRGGGAGPGDVEPDHGHLVRVATRVTAGRRPRARASRRPARGAPAPNRTRSPSTAGQALIPARIRVRQPSSPSAAANA